MYKLLDEIDLFSLGIKPGLILTRREYELNSERLNGIEYFKAPLDKYGLPLFLSTKQTTVPEEIEEQGIALGFYPRACKLYSEAPNTLKFIDKFNQLAIYSYLNFNGIVFNTELLTEDALNWCMLNYGQAILNVQGFLVISLSCGLPENGSETIILNQEDFAEYVKGNLTLPTSLNKNKVFNGRFSPKQITDKIIDILGDSISIETILEVFYAVEELMRFDSMALNLDNVIEIIEGL